MSNRLQKRHLHSGPRKRQTSAVRRAGASVESLEDRLLLAAHPVRVISGRVFNDINGNGTRQGKEHWLKNVAVYIDLNDNGVEDPGEPATVTNKVGVFTFRRLQKGIYTVIAIPPAGDVATKPLFGVAAVNVNKHNVLNLRFGEQTAPPGPPVTTLPDTSPPTSTIDAEPVIAPGYTPYRFTVTYSDATAVDVSTFGDGNIIVTGPGNFSEDAGLAALDSVSDGSPRMATYQIAAPTGGWSQSSNGTYTIDLLAGQITDTLGNSDPAQALGTFAVNINSAAPNPPQLVGGINNITASNNASPANELTFSVANTAPGTQLTLEADGTPVGTAAATSSTTTITTDGFTRLSDGPHVFAVMQSFTNGTSAMSGSTTVSVDTTGPTDALSASPITSGGGSTYSFTVNFTDGTQVSAASIAGGNLRIAPPSGATITPTLVSLSTIGNAASIVATYSINAPGGTWTTARNGTYTISLLANQVYDVVHNAALGRAIGTFTVSIGQPLSPVPGVPVLSAGSDTGFSNSDDVTNLNNSSGAAALQFTVPGVQSGALVTLYSDGTPIGSTTASGSTAVITTSGTTALANGSRVITASQTVPGDGMSSASSPLAITVDTQMPTAASSPANVNTFGATSYSFSVVYTDNVAINSSSLATGDITVSGPNGFSAVAALQSINTSSNGTPRTATYSITPPGGSWSAADNGTYTIQLAAGQVFDTAGNAAAAGSIATFTVNAGLISSPIPAAPTLLAVSDTGESNSDGLTDLNNASTSGELQFNVNSTIAGASVSIYSDGVLIGSGTAAGTSTVVTTNGTTRLIHGPHTITARQTAPGEGQSTDSSGTTITIDSTAPVVGGVSAANVTTAGATSYAFTVTYTDNTAVQAATLGNGDIVVTSGGTSLPATFILATPNTDSASITATYQITPPGGSWNSADNGTYSINVQSGQVKDTAGNNAAPVSAGSFTVSIPTSPTAAPGAPNLLASADTGLSQNDNLTNLNNSSGINALQFSVANTIAGTTVTIYSDGITIGSAIASGSTTTIATNGTTTIVDGSHSITARQQAPGQLLSSPSAGQSITIDTTPPTAIASLTDVTVSDSTYTFTVTYTDTVAVDPSTIDGGDIMITGPNGFIAQASLVSVDSSTPGPSRTGTYMIAANNGAWANTDNGTYTVTLEPGQVLDTAGNAAPSGVLGTFNINVP